MSDDASCACLRVEYRTFPSETHPGSIWGHWVCNLCGSLFLPKRFAEYQQREAVRAALDGVCVKKQEAEPMGGELKGAALEQALKDDAKDREMKWGDPKAGPKFPPPSPEVVKVLGDGLLKDAGMADLIAKPVPEPKPPIKDLPDGMRTVLYVQEGDMWLCRIEGFGFRAVAESRNKQKALAYALEDIARQMVEAANRG
jgi:hypothetical protein